MPKTSGFSRFSRNLHLLTRFCVIIFELRSLICYKIGLIPKRKKPGPAIASVSVKMSILSDWTNNSRRICI
jgi:hypothetical protein